MLWKQLQISTNLYLHIMLFVKMYKNSEIEMRSSYMVEKCPSIYRQKQVHISHLCLKKSRNNDKTVKNP